MNMVKAITSFIDVMSMILKVDKGKEQFFPKQDFDDQQKENGHKKMYSRLLTCKIPNINNINTYSIIDFKFSKVESLQFIYL